MNHGRHLKLFFVAAVLIVLPFLCVGNSFAAEAAAKSKTLSEAYPRISEGFLKNAILSKLEDGVILSSKEIVIKERELDEIISKTDPKIRDQLKKSLFYVLDHEATRRFLIKEAGGAQGASPEAEEESIKNYLRAKAESAPPATDEEVKRFYEENKAALEGVTFEQVSGEIKQYLSELKRQEAVQKAVLGVADGKVISISDEWVKKYYALALDNPVEKARGSGIPTMVEFGASGCKPCDMMQPILERLRKKYDGRLNVVFVHVGEEQILGARYGIRTIPVQAFYDKEGKEVHRHVGYYPEPDVEQVLAKLGLK
jgi:thioredoxin 1